MRFLYDFRGDLVTKKQLLDGLGILLKQSDIADLAIEDLRKWRCWDFTPRILALWGQKSRSTRLLHASILRYALQCPRDEAVQFMAEQRRVDNQTVKDMEELLSFEKANGPVP